MPRRPIPGQASLLDVLDASLAGPIVRPGADPVWAARLLELVAEGLPPGAPPPFREVLSARPGVRGGSGQISDVWGEAVMFDGAVHGYHVSWSPGHRVYSFGYPLGMEDAPRFGWRPAYPSFWWDEAASAWVRGEPRREHYAGQWSAHLGRPGFEGYLVGPPIDAARRAAA
ncbi:hypothetical protein ACIQW5_25975 [Methylorubrum thiocyanatum]|uniref:hypothetical protein n=1 Tax=Methylorubrum TaxID=2282523 RepID=UPI000DB81DD3|nr:hypothetical protein [Methylorubrum populi]PZP68382.1 MAG: hypothetical protein DI590_16670 [Methylorubrum populi]